jgi:putative DNA primase/helicase
MLEWALWFTRNGWPVFPAHGVQKGAVCTCRHGPECSSIGKHPATRRGWKDATLDPGQVKEWFADNPNYNLALACGSITVLDVDGEKGRQSLEELLDNDRAAYLRKTPRARTGGGGWHLFFQGVEVKNLVGFKPGLDIRSQGGHVILPPSLHVSGKRYAFDRCPTKFKLQKFPQWLHKIVTEEKPRAPSVPMPAIESGNFDDLPIIDEYRNNALTSLCGRLFKRGHTVDDVSAMLLAINENKCRPPLGRTEVEKIVWSISRYH